MLTPSVERLLRQLADGRFHSGEELARVLGVSRSAVWKHIRRLGAVGLEVQAVPGRGYRLAQPLEWLERQAILAALELPAGMPRPELEIHLCLPSTNAYLLQRAREYSPASVCLAEFQTAGKGRLGRRWVSPLGCNLYLSVLWRFQDAAATGGLSLAVGVAVVRALREMGFPDLQLKWPNDVLWQGRKLGGILIEAVSEHQNDCWVVVGLGLNFWLPKKAAADIDQPWVDARTILGSVPPRNLAVARILGHLLPLLRTYETTGLTPWLEDWRRWNCVLGRKVTVSERQKSYEALAVAVTSEGLLLLEDARGGRRLLAAGDVRLRCAED